MSSFFCCYTELCGYYYSLLWLKKNIKDKDSVEVFYAEAAIPGIYKWQV